MFDGRESEKSQLTPELAALEQKMMGLELAPSRLDRDRLMFAAGRAAEQSHRKLAATLSVAGTPGWFWPTATGVTTAACVILGAMLVWRDDATVVAQQQAKPQAEKVPEVGRPTEDVERLATGWGSSIWSTRPSTGYLGMRHVALTQGVGQLPSEPSIVGENGNFEDGGDSTRPATARELFQEFVPSATRVHTSS